MILMFSVNDVSRQVTNHRSELHQLKRTFQGDLCRRHKFKIQIVQTTELLSQRHRQGDVVCFLFCVHCPLSNVHIFGLRNNNLLFDHL